MRFLKLPQLHLHYPATEEQINYLLERMPTLTCLSVNHGSTFSWHEIRCANVLPNMFRTLRMFTELDFSNVIISDDDLIALVTKYSGSLRRLRLNCSSLSRGTYVEIAKCTELSPGGGTV